MKIHKTINILADNKIYMLKSHCLFTVSYVKYADRQTAKTIQKKNFNFIHSNKPQLLNMREPLVLETMI